MSHFSGSSVLFVLCGGNFSPTGMIWPLAGHHAQQRRMECQSAASEQLKGQLWQQVVAGKILAQGHTLKARGQQRTGAFADMARQVAPGDPSNIEARAARRYWQSLLGKEFRRDPNGPPPNGLLNYGYAVLRAATARALCGAGLHPGMGIFHRHPFNPMPLADDMMELFRPVFDRHVAEIVEEMGGEVTPQAKKRLAAVLETDLRTCDGHTPLSGCLTRLAFSLADSFQKQTPLLDIPLDMVVDHAPF